MQVRYAASHVQHMQKAMEQMNVKLTEVVTDITGLTGMSIIDAILEGERDPDQTGQTARSALSSQRGPDCPRVGRNVAARTSLRASAGHELYQFHHRQITECDQQVEAELAKFPNRAGEKTRGRQAAEAGARATTSGSRRRARCSRPWAWT